VFLVMSSTIGVGGVLNYATFLFVHVFVAVQINPRLGFFDVVVLGGDWGRVSFVHVHELECCKWCECEY